MDKFIQILKDNPFFSMYIDEYCELEKKALEYMHTKEKNCWRLKELKKTRKEIKIIKEEIKIIKEEIKNKTIATKRIELILKIIKKIGKDLLDDIKKFVYDINDEKSLDIYSSIVDKLDKKNIKRILKQ